MSETPDQRGRAEAAATGARFWKPFALLAERGYRGVWIAGACIHSIRWLEILAVSVFVFTVTGSAFDVSLVMFLRYLPMALLGGIVGSIATVVSRRMLLGGCLALIALARGLLGILVVLHAIEFWHIAAGMFLAGVIDSNELPVRRSLAVDFAGPARTASALALDQATNVGTMAIGPFVGGILLETIGLEGAYLAGAAVTALAVVIVLRLPGVAAPGEVPKMRLFSGFAEGLAYVRSERLLVGALAVTVSVNFFGVPVLAMVPVIGKEQLDLGAGAIGVLMSAQGLGAFLATLVLAVWQPSSLQRTYALGAVSFLLALLLFPALPWYAASFAVLFVAGVGVAGFSTNQAAIVFLNSAPAFRYRTVGLMTMCIGTSPFGMLHVGVLADWLGAPAAVSVITVEGLAATVVALFLWPELLRGR